VRDGAHTRAPLARFRTSGGFPQVHGTRSNRRRARRFARIHPCPTSSTTAAS
jgi:hypothetical protein